MAQWLNNVIYDSFGICKAKMTADLLCFTQLSLSLPFSSTIWLQRKSVRYSAIIAIDSGAASCNAHAKLIVGACFIRHMHIMSTKCTYAIRSHSSKQEIEFLHTNHAFLLLFIIIKYYIEQKWLIALISRPNCPGYVHKSFRKWHVHIYTYTYIDTRDTVASIESRVCIHSGYSNESEHRHICNVNINMVQILNYDQITIKCSYIMFFSLSLCFQKFSIITIIIKILILMFGPELWMFVCGKNHKLAYNNMTVCHFNQPTNSTAYALFCWINDKMLRVLFDRCVCASWTQNKSEILLLLLLLILYIFINKVHYSCTGIVTGHSMAAATKCTNLPTLLWLLFKIILFFRLFKMTKIISMPCGQCSVHVYRISSFSSYILMHWDFVCRHDHTNIPVQRICVQTIIA